ncbi:MAG: KOW domain-containing RNA-binding protein [Clostridia bacterium]|nr:KOW domain-containing RNA-binding protein [Clostridia bacterium]
MNIIKGTVVISKAGRDKGECLAVIGTDAVRLLVCNGKDRPLENPKSKNPAHIEVTGTVLPPEAFRGNRALKKALSLCGGKSEVQ